MRGIILAGGTGSRLRPATHVVSKQLLPVYDKPMVHYPLSTLMLAGISEVLVITTPEDAAQFRRLLGDGSQLGITITYAAQPSPGGIAQAFLVGEEHLAGGPAALALGDNLFHGADLGARLRSCTPGEGAVVFGRRVVDASAYGMVELDGGGRPLALTDPPHPPMSGYAVPGLYFYGADVVDRARMLRPSARGELEIGDLNRLYLAEGRLRVELLPDDTVWLDAGTFDRLNDAGNVVRGIEEREGTKVGVPEEVAWRMGLIDDARLAELAEPLMKSGYGTYLLGLLDGDH